MGATSTARVRLCRARQRAGLVRIPVLADEAALEVLLMHHGLLLCHGAKDHDELAYAVGQLLERLIAADAESKTMDRPL